MPVYRDRANGITRRAIESVLTQTFSNIELIIVDDGSNDGLFNILREYRRADDRVSVIRHNANSGLPALRVNEGLLVARAPLVAYQFEDDVWYKDALSHLHKSLPGDTADFIVYGNVLMVSHSGEQVGIIGKGPINRSSLLQQNRLANCSVLHPLSLLSKIGMYDPQVLLRRLSDHDLWLRASRVADFIHVPELIGEVTVAHEHSLGRGVHLDRELTLPLLGIDKAARLAPESMPSYDILVPFRPVTRSVETAVWREAVAPYAAQHPDLFTRDERSAIAAKTSADRCNAVFKAAYSTSVDVTLGNFVHSLSGEEHLFTFYGEVDFPITGFIERAILYRTVSPATSVFAADCSERGISTVYVMDDNMFAFHEAGLEHAYLRPGTPNYIAIEQQVKTADIVIVYSEEVERACRVYNPRVLRLETNIRASRLNYVSPHSTNERRKVALVTSPIREAELKLLWSEITATLNEFHDVELHCWGFDPSPLGLPDNRVVHRHFDQSYERYLDRLQAENFEVLLAPLFDDNAVKRSKSPIKYVEAAAAGALLLVSDVSVYGKIRDGLTAIKVANELGAWRSALTKALSMDPEDRAEIIGRARRDVAKRFTSEQATVDMATALVAADLHCIFRSIKIPLGRPSVLYVFGHTALGGATLHLLDHARLMAALGVKPIICTRQQDPINSDFKGRVDAEGWELFTFPFEVSLAPEALRANSTMNLDFLSKMCSRLDVRLIHATPYSADWVSVAETLELPLVLSLHQAYGVPTSLTQFGRPHGVHCSSQLYGRIWASSFACPTHVFPAPVSAEHFVIGESRVRGTGLARNGRITILVSGTVQPRKGQLRAAVAVANLIEDGYDLELVLAGYTEWFPEYLQACQTEFDLRGMADRLTVHGFVQDMRPLYAQADIVLCSSDDESQPQAVLFGMASGCLAISAPAGGVREIIKDGFNGFIASGTSSVALQEALTRALKLSDVERHRAMARGLEASWTRSHPRFTQLRLAELYVAACREAAERRFRGSRAVEPQLVEITLAGEVGKRLYIYGLIVDGKNIDFASSLADGWSQHEDFAGKFIFKNEESSSVLNFRVGVARSMQVKILATRESGAIQVEVGELSTAFNAFSEVPGGEFRVFDVPLPVLFGSSSRNIWPFEGRRAVQSATRETAQDDIVSVEGRGDNVVVNGTTHTPRRVVLASGGKMIGTFTPAISDGTLNPWTIAVPTPSLDFGPNLLIPFGRTEIGLEQVGAPVIVGKLPNGDAILPGDVIGAEVTVLPLSELDTSILGAVDIIEVEGEKITVEGWCRPSLNQSSISVVILGDSLVIGVTAPWFERAGLSEALGDSAYRFGGWRTTFIAQRPRNVLVGLALEFPPRSVYVIGGASISPLEASFHEDGSAPPEYDASSAVVRSRDGTGDINSDRGDLEDADECSSLERTGGAL
ncbi:glycosyltransferase [Methylobacterium longum]|nr:glycosyltransferase [Methylobacterium longum]